MVDERNFGQIFADKKPAANDNKEMGIIPVGQREKIIIDNNYKVFLTTQLENALQRLQLGEELNPLFGQLDQRRLAKDGVDDEIKGKIKDLVDVFFQALVVAKDKSFFHEANLERLTMDLYELLMVNGFRKAAGEFYDEFKMLAKYLAKKVANIEVE